MLHVTRRVAMLKAAMLKAARCQAAVLMAASCRAAMLNAARCRAAMLKDASSRAARCRTVMLRTARCRAAMLRAARCRAAVLKGVSCTADGEWILQHLQAGLAAQCLWEATMAPLFQTGTEVKPYGVYNLCQHTKEGNNPSRNMDRIC